jgi:hypothetical protein
MAIIEYESVGQNGPVCNEHCSSLFWLKNIGIFFIEQVFKIAYIPNIILQNFLKYWLEVALIM